MTDEKKSLRFPRTVLAIWLVLLSVGPFWILYAGASAGIDFQAGRHGWATVMAASMFLGLGAWSWLMIDLGESLERVKAKTR